jgi:4-amino-4-deoxy-L-arabinose transferase-like glycosyltransferase
MKGLTVQFKRWLPGVILLIILVVAAYLRIYKIENYLTFLGDEGRDVLVVKRMIVDHKFTLLGPTASVGGFFLGPIYYYFMVPFLWAWGLNPVGPAVMVAVFGVATVYLVYLVGLRFFGTIAGLVAASLYAVSPLVIAYSRSSWNPNVVPFFATLLIYLLWLLGSQKRQWAALYIGIVLGIGIQLHYLFLFLFVLVGVWYGCMYKILPLWRTICLTLVGLLIGASPFIAFELRHDFSNTRTIIKFLLAGDETGFSLGGFFQTLSDVSFRLFSRIVFRMPPTELWNGYPDWYITTLSLLSHVSRWVMVWFVAISVFVMRKKKELLLLALWVFVPLVLFGFYKRGIYDYYFGIIFAFPFLFFGWLAQSLWKERASQVFVGILWAALVLFNWQGRPFIYPPNNQLAQVRTIAQTAFDQTGGEPFNFALITDGNSDHAYRYFFEIWGNPPVVIQNTDVDPDRTSVTKQLIVICETINCQPLGHPLWEVAGFGRAQVVGSWEAPFVTIHKLVPYVE